MTPDEAIETVADEVVADLLAEWGDGYTGKQWEDFPMIGELDWERVQKAVESRIDYPRRLDKAVQLLKGRANND